MDKENKCEERQVWKRQNRMKENKNPIRKSWGEERKTSERKRKEWNMCPFRWLLAVLVRIRERTMGGTETELAWTK